MSTKYSPNFRGLYLTVSFSYPVFLCNLGVQSDSGGQNIFLIRTARWCQVIFWNHIVEDIVQIFILNAGLLLSSVEQFSSGK